MFPSFRMFLFLEDLHVYHNDGMTFIDITGYVLFLFSSSIIDWNNPLIINKMFKVYLGDVPLKTKVCKFSVLT